jgi:hypothetical protein
MFLLTDTTRYSIAAFHGREKFERAAKDMGLQLFDWYIFNPQDSGAIYSDTVTRRNVRYWLARCGPDFNRFGMGLSWEWYDMTTEAQADIWGAYMRSIDPFTRLYGWHDDMRDAFEWGNFTPRQWPASTLTSSNVRNKTGGRGGTGVGLTMSTTWQNKPQMGSEDLWITIADAGYTNSETELIRGGWGCLFAGIMEMPDFATVWDSSPSRTKDADGNAHEFWEPTWRRMINALYAYGRRYREWTIQNGLVSLGTSSGTICSGVTDGSGAEYAVYIQGGGTVNLNLAGESGARTFNITYVSQAIGLSGSFPVIRSGGTVAGGASRVLTGPFGDDDCIAFVYTATVPTANVVYDVHYQLAGTTYWTAVTTAQAAPDVNVVWDTALIPAGSYTVRVRARNLTTGEETAYVTRPLTVITVPGVPTAVSAAAGNGQATISFTPPANNGGSAITGYTATSTPGGLTASGSASPIIVTGLTNGTAYTFKVHATNAVGNSDLSAASNSVTPTSAPGATVPGAPTIGTATAGNGQATCSFTPPASDGGSPITSYILVASPGGASTSGAGSPLTLTGLTNGTAYTFRVKAVNAVGESALSAASNSVTPTGATVPSAPNIGTATAGDAQATVTFTPPGSNGGSTITSYTVTSSPGNLTVTGAASPLTVTGLTNGTAYTFRVHATNAIGSGPQSSPSNSVTPTAAPGLPGAPTIGTATAGNTTASVTFSAPGSDGGSPILDYTVISTPGNKTVTGAGSPLVVPGLTNGTSYTFKVHARNAVGNGPQSASSNAVTPNATLTVPGAPTSVVAVKGNAQATVSFQAPNSGGSPITSYTVTASPGGQTSTGASSPRTVTGLTNGVSYTFTVRATNAIGQGPASLPSNAVIPSTVPGAPTIGTLTGGNRQVTITFSAPASNGGSAILDYTATTSTGASVTSSGSPITIGNLTNGVSVTVTVKARNINGLSAASGTSNSVTPNVPAAGARSVSLVVRDLAGNPVPNLTGYKWAWFDQARPDLLTTPVDKGTNATTNGSGVMTINLPNTNLSAGQTGYLIVSNTNGAPNQSPPSVAIAKPVTVL